jgi:signal peptidase I
MIKRTLGLVLDIVLVLVVLFLVFLAYGSMNNRWYKVLAVEGNSMSPTVEFGDVVVLVPPRPYIQNGTIVLMEVSEKDGSKSLVMHRLIADYSDGGILKTKGDANDSPDSFTTSVKIVGIAALRIPYCGYPVLLVRYLLSKIL